MASTTTVTVGSWSHWAPATLPSIQNMTDRNSVGVAWSWTKLVAERKT